jgi:hypothetical protein
MDLAIDSWLSTEMTMRKAWVFCICALLCVTANGQSNDRSTESPLIFYKVKTGDTLSKLSRKYLIQPVNLEIIRDLNSLKNIDLLPSGEILKIPREAVKQSPSFATISSLNCGRPIRAGTPLRPMSVGSVLSEGAVVDIPAECHVSVLLEDYSVIRLPSSAAIKIAILRKNALEQSPEVRLDLVRGRVELEVFKGRSKTTPFEVRTPLSVTGVRGTDFRVGYTPTEQTGQVEVLGGVVRAMGIRDDESRSLVKGQGMPFDSTGKALPPETLLGAPVFERADPVSQTPNAYDIKLSVKEQAKHYVAISSKTANLLGERSSYLLQTPEVSTSTLTQSATFYQFASVSNAGLMGSARQYGFCSVIGDVRAARCRAIFEAPMAEKALITFTLKRQFGGTAQELVSTQKLRAHKGQFVIEGLPAGQYNWSLSYVSGMPEAERSTPSKTIKQSGSFDLIALSSTAP